MKRIMSISLGSSKRNHAVETDFLGQRVLIERIGTDGSLSKAMELVQVQDGKVDVFGLGGIDLYLYAGDKRYTIRDAARIAAQARITPVVDGSGLKNTLERKVIGILNDKFNLDFSGRPVLLVCGVDRFGMAQSLVQAGARVTFGDLVFALGLPIPLSSLSALERVAKVVIPIAANLPFQLLYPTGKKQEGTKSKHSYLYNQADIIAGDFHYIKKYMPDDLVNKIVITNTVTKSDVEELRQRGVHMLVTTTPELKGRSFGTNVMEAVLVALAGKSPQAMHPEDYARLLDEIGFSPRVEYLH